MGCATPLLISSGLSHYLSNVGFLFATFSPTQSCDALVTNGTLCGSAYPIPSEHLGRHRNQVWVSSDTTCHKTITLSPKVWSDGVCSATPYKLRTFRSLIRCEILIDDTRLADGDGSGPPGPRFIHIFWTWTHTSSKFVGSEKMGTKLRSYKSDELTAPDYFSR
ncbi:hypothetical protein Cgig2_031947 [Carnegiea gigantea]|uniref:Uncharacterized protein n=1 Tax=Carnegiea gigantea TaxID=171969 RepID=A0A9Q1K534_9CARY|nr:hypothetical protein Cgig2_031947 [Carnegiea gigantea]